MDYSDEEGAGRGTSLLRASVVNLAVYNINRDKMQPYTDSAEESADVFDLRLRGCHTATTRSGLMVRARGRSESSRGSSPSVSPGSARLLASSPPPETYALE